MSAFTSLLFGSLSFYILYSLYFFSGLLKHKRSGSIKNTATPKVSVIVAARNEAKHIAHLLEDLSQQDYPASNLEIIIVDDRSTDHTSNIIQDFVQRFSHFSGIYITKTSKTMRAKKYALTQAIRQSSGEIIVTTDADCRVPPSWISSMVNSFDDSTGLVVGYSKVTGPPESFFTAYQTVDYLSLMSANAGGLGWGRALSGSGHNLAYRRKYFNEIGGFQSTALKIYADDLYLVQAITKLSNIRFNCSADSFVSTAAKRTIHGFFSQRIRWGSNFRSLFRADLFFFFFLGIAFLTNLLLLTELIIPVNIEVLAITFLSKYLVDSLVTYTGGYLFQTHFNPLAFTLWVLIQPFYITLIGLLSMIGKFRWK